jgi:hypothetical protein
MSRHLVFISHSSRDHPMAAEACRALEQAGFPCWMAPRDILAGTTWSASIVDAIRDARAMVVLVSAAANASGQIVRELTIAADQGLSIIPLCIDGAKPSGSLEYFLTAQHWLDAGTGPGRQIPELVRAVGLALEQQPLIDPHPDPTPVHRDLPPDEWRARPTRSGWIKRLFEDR